MNKLKDNIEYVIIALFALFALLFIPTICRANSINKPVEVSSKYYYCCAYERADNGTLISFESPDGEECQNIEINVDYEYVKAGDKYTGWVLERIVYSDGGVGWVIYNPDTTDGIYSNEVYKDHMRYDD